MTIMDTAKGVSWAMTHKRSREPNDKTEISENTAKSLLAFSLV